MSTLNSLDDSVYIYIYVYSERERERDIYIMYIYIYIHTHTYTHTCCRCCLLFFNHWDIEPHVVAADWCFNVETNIETFHMRSFTRLAETRLAQFTHRVRTPIYEGGGTVDWDTVAPNCSTGNCLSNFNKRISSKSLNWDIWARKARIETFELDEGFQPYHPPFRV